MNHIGTNSIETMRLILRRFRPEDTFDMYSNWASDIETLRYLPWGPHSDVNVTHRRILSWVANYEQANVYNWAIYLKTQKQVIGSISVEMSNDKEESCEVGYCIGKSFWGREIVVEALRAIMHYLFYEVGYKKIFARYDVLNTASGRVMQKVGMHYDRTMKDVGRRRDGSLYDVVIYVKYKDDLEEEPF
ncbi:MAG: GNAT family N-acetyltransferase [Clostridiales bacterium]|nr:GNAT family N-acetyltransferase [Clostridiales bacterium]